VVVHAGATLDQCIVTDGVAVPAGAEYRRAVLMQGDGTTITVANLEL
jgi:hypothetical protein